MEKEDSTTCSKGRMTELDDEGKNKVLKKIDPKDTIMDSKEEEENIEPMTPRSKMGSNDVNSTPTKIGFTMYVQHKNKRYHWYSKEVEVRCME